MSLLKRISMFFLDLLAKIFPAEEIKQLPEAVPEPIVDEPTGAFAAPALDEDYLSRDVETAEPTPALKALFAPPPRGEIMFQRGAKGEAVRDFQKMLMELGYPLPRWGADGQLGEETMSALVMFLHAHGIQPSSEWSSNVSVEEYKLVQDLHDKLAQPSEPTNLYDRRLLAGQKFVYGHRSWKGVTGICLHQTACVLGENPPRWDSVGCHVGITRTGKIIWLHDFDKLVVHGNSWNTKTVGIEIDGLYAGIEGNDKTVWDDPSTTRHETGMPLTNESAEATKNAIRWICNEVAKHGGKVTHLVAHRQASKDRRNDPGSAIWQRVALPLHEELKLSDGGFGFKIGTGFAIPQEWDPAKKGVKY